VIVAALIIIGVFGDISPPLLIPSLLLSLGLGSLLLGLQLLGHRLGSLGIVFLQRLRLHRSHLLKFRVEVR